MARHLAIGELELGPLTGKTDGQWPLPAVGDEMNCVVRTDVSRFHVIFSFLKSLQKRR